MTGVKSEPVTLHYLIILCIFTSYYGHKNIINVHFHFRNIDLRNNVMYFEKKIICAMFCLQKLEFKLDPGYEWSILCTVKHSFS